MADACPNGLSMSDDPLANSSSDARKTTAGRNPWNASARNKVVGAFVFLLFGIIAYVAIHVADATARYSYARDGGRGMPLGGLNYPVAKRANATLCAVTSKPHFYPPGNTSMASFSANQRDEVSPSQSPLWM